jgi:hypothetical protein
MPKGKKVKGIGKRVAKWGGEVTSGGVLYATDVKLARQRQRAGGMAREGSQFQKKMQGVIRKVSKRRGAPGIEPDAAIKRPQLYQQRPQNDANLYKYQDRNFQLLVLQVKHQTHNSHYLRTQPIIKLSY